MSANALVALEANFKQWKERRFPSGDGSLDLHEYYCVEQYTRPYALTDGELQSGLTGGGQDGGVDAFYILANNELVDSETEIDPKNPPSFRLLVMQIKSSEGFSPIAVDKLNWFLGDLLDLSKGRKDYHTGYREDLIRLIRVFKDKYGLVVGDSPKLKIECIYVVKKQVEPNADCNRSARDAEATVKQCFTHAEIDILFVNASKLWEQVQSRPPISKKIHWAASPLTTPEGYVGLVNLVDFKDFITDPDGRVAERFFDSNVRGYWPGKTVNKSIAATLEKEGSPEFWLLNNGITILAGSIGAGEYLENEIADPQIVNGLQTSRQIYRHYTANPPKESDARRVLIRIIKIEGDDARDEVIRCTNSQNKMPPEALRSTDAIHRQIEAVFLSSGLYYDRRKGHHRDQGKPVSQIVDVIEVLQAMLSIVLQRPDDARARPRDYIKKDAEYDRVFGEGAYSITLFLRATQIMRRIGRFLSEQQDLEPIHRRNIFFYLCMYATCASYKSAHAIPNQIQAVDAEKLTDSFLKDCYTRVWGAYLARAAKESQNDEQDFDAVAKGKGLLSALSANLKRRFQPAKKKQVEPKK